MVITATADDYGDFALWELEFLSYTPSPRFRQRMENEQEVEASIARDRQGSGRFTR